jgi:ribonuclease J
VRYFIHGGAHQIGGMCIEVAADDGTRLLLDLGMPLVAPDGGEFVAGTARRPARELLEEGVLPAVAGLYPHDTTSPDVAAILVTHSHLDHYGLAHHAHPAVPVYASPGTRGILEVGRVFFPRDGLPADLRVLPTDEPLRLGGLTVTAIPVDHSAPDSRALLVAADGRRLLYTGDLRAHGRTGFRFERLLTDPRVRGVDWLLCEGTTLGSSGDSHGMRSEAEVEEELVRLAEAAPGKLLAVAASGQNVDRLVSCYRAARRVGRQLVIDSYQAFVLMKLAELSPNIPQFTWRQVRVSFAPHQVRRLKAAGLMELAHEMGVRARVSSDQLAAEPGRYLFCMRGGYGTTKLLDKVGPERVAPVWSLWRGYWERDGNALREWCELNSVEIRLVHSGGHAWPEDLRRLKDAIGAAETVWVHTDAETSQLAD